MTGIGITQAIMDSVLDKLRAEYSHQLEIDYFPEDPQNYRLNHPVGALLLGFSRGQFGSDLSTDAVFVEREITLPLTLVFRQLKGPDGVIHYLDLIRTTLTGYQPPHTDRPLRPVAEQFIGQTQGIWQYAQDWTTRTMQVQVAPVPGEGLFQGITFHEEP